MSTSWDWDDIVDHESNCAACGVYPRWKHHRHCKDCREALVLDGDRADNAGKSE